MRPSGRVGAADHDSSCRERKNHTRVGIKCSRFGCSNRYAVEKAKFGVDAVKQLKGKSLRMHRRTTPTTAL